MLPHIMSGPASVLPAPGRDRRRSRRRALLDEHGILTVCVRPGQEASLVDVSAAGALLETGRRLLPGTAIELHVGIRGRRALVRGRVLRCAVSDLAGGGGPRYRAAINFDQPLSWLADGARSGYELPADDRLREVDERAEATPYGR